MQKPKDQDLELISQFIQMAGRYLDGGVDHPKFKLIVAWALQNIPYLRQALVEGASDFRNYECGQMLKAAKERQLDEFKKIPTEKHIWSFIEANNLPESEFEGIKSDYYRIKKRQKYPKDIKNEVTEIIFHTGTDGKHLNYFKNLERRRQDAHG